MPLTENGMGDELATLPSSTKMVVKSLAKNWKKIMWLPVLAGNPLISKTGN
jgi:hypothetical protein